MVVYFLDISRNLYTIYLLGNDQTKEVIFNFQVVDFPFICCNIPAAYTFGVYISQLTRYSRTCDSYHDCRKKRRASADKEAAGPSVRS